MNDAFLNLFIWLRVDNQFQISIGYISNIYNLGGSINGEESFR